MNGNPVYLLLDTSTWISIQRNQPVIQSLNKLVASEKVVLLIPQLVKDEWERNKTKHRTSETKKLSEIQKKIAALKVTNETREQLLALMAKAQDDITKTSEKNILDVDSLFKDRRSILIPSYAKAKKQAAEFALEKKAGFDQKNKVADIVIFLTMIEFATKRGLENVCFVTENFNDFSAPGNKEQLHPDLHVLINTQGFTYSLNIANTLNGIQEASVPAEVANDISERISIYESIVEVNKHLLQAAFLQEMDINSVRELHKELTKTLDLSVHLAPVLEHMDYLDKANLETIRTSMLISPVLDSIGEFYKELLASFDVSAQFAPLLEQIEQINKANLEAMRATMLPKFQTKQELAELLKIPAPPADPDPRS